jgi:tetratricopeptide (TPR) repeat protein
MSRGRASLVALTGCVVTVALLGAPGLWWYKTSRPDYRLRKGEEALERNDFTEAERQADRLQAAGYADQAHLLRGQAHLRSNELNPAIQEYNLISRDNEAVLTEASLIYGLAFLKLGSPARAERLLLFVTQTQPDNVEARRGLAALYYDRGAMKQALRHLEKWSRLDDTNGQPHRFMGVIFKDYAADEMALEHYQAALQRHLTPGVREEVVLELADVYIKRNQYAEALATLDLGPLESDKAQTEGTELRAMSLYGLHRAAEAVTILEPLLQTSNASPRALRLRAQIYADGRDFSAAAPLLERALRIDPHEPTCRYQLALAYELLGRRKEAAEQRRLLDETQKMITTLGDLNREADQKPNDVAVRLRLADLCDRLGKFELAQSWRRAAASCQAAQDVE